MLTKLLETKYYRMTAKKLRRFSRKKDRFERYGNLKNCPLSKKITSTIFLSPRQLQQYVH